MKNVEIYTLPGCGYCLHAKQMLKSRGICFREYDVYQHPHKIDEMRGRTRHTSFPQVFVNGRSIGGYEELINYEQLNALPNCA